MITLEDLEGRWSLDRRIEDRRAGLTGRLVGTCVWRRDASGLLQEESGLLHYGEGPPLQADRRYLWRAEGSGLAVFFEDGRPFHRLDAERPAALHLCDPDTYEVTYLFDERPAFSTIWRVTGPRKDQVITSRYSPLAAAGA